MEEIDRIDSMEVVVMIEDISMRVMDANGERTGEIHQSLLEY